MPCLLVFKKFQFFNLTDTLLCVLSCPHRHAEKCAGVIAAVLNNSKCGVGLAYKAKLGGIVIL